MVKLFSKGSRANTKLKNGCDENLITERNYLTGQRLQLRKFCEALTRNSEVLSSFQGSSACEQMSYFLLIGLT